jgi:hypothetical protein
MDICEQRAMDICEQRARQLRRGMASIILCVPSDLQPEPAPWPSPHRNSPPI